MQHSENRSLIVNFASLNRENENCSPTARNRFRRSYRIEKEQGGSVGCSAGKTFSEGLLEGVLTVSQLASSSCRHIAPEAAIDRRE